MENSLLFWSNPTELIPSWCWRLLLWNSFYWPKAYTAGWLKDNWQEGENIMLALSCMPSLIPLLKDALCKCILHPRFLLAFFVCLIKYYLCLSRWRSKNPSFQMALWLCPHTLFCAWNSDPHRRWFYSVPDLCI